MDTVPAASGASHIGLHACKTLKRAGFLPAAIDNLAAGREDAARFGPRKEGDLLDRKRIGKAIRARSPVAALHFATLTGVGELAVSPGLHWYNDVVGTLNLIEAMVEAGCPGMVFPSTCLIHGEANGRPAAGNPRNCPETSNQPRSPHWRACSFPSGTVMAWRASGFGISMLRVWTRIAKSANITARNFLSAVHPAANRFPLRRRQSAPI